MQIFVQFPKDPEELKRKKLIRLNEKLQKQ